MDRIVCIILALVLLAIGLRRELERAIGRVIIWAWGFEIPAQRVPSAEVLQALRSQRG